MTDMNNLDKIYTQNITEFSRAYLDYLANVMQQVSLDEIGVFVETLLDARERGACIYFIGNGGSASTASHFANDLGIGTRIEGVKFRTMSLADNNSIITAVGNDFGYEEVFTRQLEITANSGDVLVAISCSGNSPNLVHAFEWAKNKGIKTVALSAFDGGKIREMADIGIHVPTLKGEYGPAEDAHLILNHLIAAYIMRRVPELA